MRKILYLFLLQGIFLAFGARAQIVITGVMADPRFTDARDHANPAPDAPANSVANHLGGFEYIQLRATVDIDFSTTPYALVIARNDAANPVTANGWAEGGNQTYKFNLTSGQVNKGDFFYVGGIEKRIAGYKNGRRSTDISETAPITANQAKWIRAKKLFEAGDDNFGNGGNQLTGLMDVAKPYAIAVFSTTTVLNTSKPIDALFFIPNATESWVESDGTKGYRVPDNDFYDSSESEYFYQNGKNINYLKPEQETVVGWVTADANFSWFCKLGGTYDLTTQNWVTARTATYDRLVTSSTTVHEHETIPLSRIEAGAGITVLPVKLTSFTAQGSSNGILLKWTTQTEMENSHFDILRASDKNNEFTNIASVKGKGTTSTQSNYNFRDPVPVNGINYYKLRQIDNNGEEAYSDVVFASAAIDRAKLNVATSKEAIEFSIYSLYGGNSEIRLININGNIIKKTNLHLEKGFNSLRWANNFSTGVYVVQVSSPTEVMKEKLIVR